MQGRVFACYAVIGTAVLCAVGGAIAANGEERPPGAQPAASDDSAPGTAQAALIQQRDKIVAEGERLYREGQPDTAIELADRVIEVQREIAGGDDDNIANTLEWVANVLVEKNDFQAALDRRRRALKIRTTLHGEQHWLSINARLGVQRLERLVNANDEERDAFATASRLYIQAQTRRATNEFAEAANLIEQALELRERVHGKEQLYAKWLLELASLWNLASDSTHAEALVRQAVEICRKVLGADHPDLAEALYKLGAACAAQSKFEAAIAPCEEAVAIYARVVPGGNESSAQALHVLTLALDLAGRRPEAVARYQELVDVRRRVFGEQSMPVADALIDLARQQYLLSKHEEARPNYAEAVALLRHLPGDNQLRLAEVLTDMARTHTERSQIRDATPFILEAVTIKRRLLANDDPQLAEALQFAGDVLTATVPHGQIMEFLNEAVTVRRRAAPADPRALAGALQSLAVAHDCFGETTGAARCIEEIERIAEQGGAELRDVRLRALVTKGSILKAAGQYAESLSVLEEAVAGLAEMASERHTYATALSNLAFTYDAVGDYARSRQLWQNSAEVLRGVDGDLSLSYGLALGTYGFAAFSGMEYETARSAFDQAKSIFQASLGEDNLVTVIFHVALSACHLAKQEPADAEREARIVCEALARIDTADQTVGMQLLARTLRVQGKIEQAIDLYRDALSATQRAATTNSFAYAELLVERSATELAIGRRETAAEGYRQALVIRRQLADVVFSALSERQQLALTDSLRGNLDVCLKLDDEFSADELYDYALRWKGAVYARQRWMRSQEKSPQLRERFAQFETISAALARAGIGGPDAGESRPAFADRIAGLSEEKERIEAELARDSSAFAQQRLSQRLDVAGLRKLLPADVVLFDFLQYDAAAAQLDRAADSPGQPHLAAFVVSRDQPTRLVQLGPVAPLEETCRKFFSALRNGYDREAGESLKRKLWEPLQQGVPADRIVLISPDGITARIPWSALPGRTANRYLLEECSIAIVPVPQLISELLDQQSPTPASPDAMVLLGGDFAYGAGGRAKDAIAAGLPSLHRLQFAPLPGTAAEITEIAQLAQATQPHAQVRVLAQESGSEAAFRRLAPSARYIHLSTHGFFTSPPKPPEHASVRQLISSLPFPTLGASGISVVAQANPGLFSGLAFAGANQHAQRRDPNDDGLLTAAEVAALLLDNTELVVLSACETGLGEAVSGEGLLGLRRSFQIAGARTAIASLWNIDDTVTAALMKVFYHKLWMEKLSPLDALREAQLAILNHPENIDTLATSRGQEFVIAVNERKPKSSVPQNERTRRGLPRLWAGFELSGDWR